jgi:predicted outer membrane protein
MVVVSRRWIWGAAVAVGVLWVARGARAQDPAQAGGPLLNTPTGPGNVEPPAKLKVAPSSAATTAVPGPPKTAALPRPAASGPVAAPQRAWNGFAAESARTATRLPQAERETRGFLRAAAMTARLETEASRLAQARGHAPGVLAFSDNVLENRESADPELLHLLHSRGMALPMMDNAQRKALNRLAKLQGARFDKQYAELVGPDQQRVAVQAYEKALVSVSDPAVRAWIERQVVVLRQQQDDAVRHLAGGEGRKDKLQAVRSAAWPGGRTTTR